MVKKRLRIIAALGVLAATAAVAVFVPAASAVLPGDGGGGYVSCSASDTTWRGLTTPRISCSGYRVGFYAYNAYYQSPCYQYGFTAKVFFVVNGSWDPYNPVWTGGPFCLDGTWHYTGAGVSTYNRGLVSEMTINAANTNWTMTIYRLA